MLESGSHMSETSHWTGIIWGTNSGTVLVELVRDQASIEGTFVLVEPGLGQTHARIIGTWGQDNKIDAALGQFTSQHSVPVVMPQSGKMQGVFDPATNTIQGEWSTDAGTNGNFALVRVAAQAPQVALPAVPQAPGVPSALVAKTVILGSYRFDEQSLRRLVDIIRSDTNVPTAAVNAAHEGREFIHLGVDSLIADPNVPSVVFNLIISANEPVIQAGTRTVTLALKRDDPNTLFVSGYDRIWVEGKAAQVESFLQHYESKAASFIRRHGQILNSIIFLLMLGFLPSIPSLTDRFKVVGATFLLLVALMYSWGMAKNTKVFLREPKIAWYERHSGWLLMLIEVALAGLIAFMIQKYVHP